MQRNYKALCRYSTCRRIRRIRYFIPYLIVWYFSCVTQVVNKQIYNNIEQQLSA